VSAQIPAVVNGLFANLPGLLSPQVFISTSSYEHSGYVTPLLPYLGRSGWTNRYEAEAVLGWPLLYQWAAVCCGQNLCRICGRGSLSKLGIS